MLKTFTLFNSGGKKVSVSQAAVQFAKDGTNGVQIRCGDASPQIVTVTETLAQVIGDLGLKAVTSGGVDHGVNPANILSLKDAAQAGNVLISYAGVGLTVAGTVDSVTADLNA